MEWDAARTPEALALREHPGPERNARAVRGKQAIGVCWRAARDDIGAPVHCAEDLVHSHPFPGRESAWTSHSFSLKRRHGYAVGEGDAHAVRRTGCLDGREDGRQVLLRHQEVQP
jgi:hypothetical protein